MQQVKYFKLLPNVDQFNVSRDPGKQMLLNMMRGE